MIIKPTDAQFIAVKMENITTPRPMTQDLFRAISDAYQIEVNEVYIYAVSEGIFYAKIKTSSLLSLENYDIECTVGDALSMAAVFDCPIFVSEEVMDNASIEVDLLTNEPISTPEPKPISSKLPPLKKKLPEKLRKESKPMSIENLDKMLQEAVEREDFEQAVILRDKIEKLKKV